MNEERIDKLREHKTPEWFEDTKFGLFFHWGPYSVPEYGNEWYSRNIYEKGHDQYQYHKEHYGDVSKFGYKDIIPLFTGEAFDAAAWAELVKLSGAQYAAPVTEHADNYSMWDSDINPVNSMKTGPHRDILKECFEEFRKQGIRCLATFHHQWLWGWFMSSDPNADVYDPKNREYYGPSLPLETNRYIPYLWPSEDFCTMWRDKVLEVIRKYNPDIVYFDSRANLIPENYKLEILEELYQNPDTVLTFKQFDFPEGTAVVDIENGRFADTRPFAWQSDDQLEDTPTWCYTKDVRYKSPERIIHQLCDITAKNGRLLLNIGPRADGSFAPEAVEIMESIGNWLRLCGEAIYATRPYKIHSEGPTFLEDNNYDTKKIEAQIELGYVMEETIHAFTPEDIRFTQRDGNVYAIAMGWPKNGQIAIRTLSSKSGAGKITKVQFLGYEGRIEWEQQEDALLLQVPLQKPYEYAYAFKITF